MSPPLSAVEESLKAALDGSRDKAAQFSSQLLDARSELEKTQQLQLLVARQLGNTREGGEGDTRSSMARAAVGGLARVCDPTDR